jgi:hypothetical protein
MEYPRSLPPRSLRLCANQTLRAFAGVTKSEAVMENGAVAKSGAVMESGAVTKSGAVMESGAV